MNTHILPARVHGRFLHLQRGGDRLLVGFHGYAETAETHLAELESIPAEDWSLVSVQALHPFYTRSGSVVASWMTKLDREQAIDDNLAWVTSVLAALPRRRKLVFAGFSQGAAMAARAAARLGCDGAILLGGDLPPELRDDPAIRFPRILLARGSRDEFYTEEKFRDDLSFLESRTRVDRCLFAGGHEWSDPFREAAGAFLRSIAAG